MNDEDSRRRRGIRDGDRLDRRRRRYAHHSFAMFDSVAAQAHRGPSHGVELQQPAQLADRAGAGRRRRDDTWSFEGAAIVHAARQGVNGKSYVKGENVRIVMHRYATAATPARCASSSRRTARSRARTTASATRTRCTRAGRRRAGSRREAPRHAPNCGLTSPPIGFPRLGRGYIMKLN